MSSPRAVVIPFGVPDDGRGLGLGLAALVHSFAQIDGESVALAQLLARQPLPAIRGSRRDAEDEDGEHEDHGDERDFDGRDARQTGEASPVEAFVPPRAWKDLTASSADPTGVSFVVTGAFEPPVDSNARRGNIQLLAFETKDGKTRARASAHVDGDNAGRAVLAALDDLWSQLGGELGIMREIGDLSWDALESVLRAERCALHDPLRGGPHDRLAAMVHLGRAIGDAPDARFPASRLASIALDLASHSGVNGAGVADKKLADAALRALLRATADAPANVDLLEAIAALTLRVGDGGSGEAVDLAEARALEALAIDPERPRLYALLSEARRSRGDLEGALAAIEDGLLHGTDDPLLNTERGIVLAERGQHEQAERAWRMVLESSSNQHQPLYPPAYTNLASLVMERKDAVAAARLVDDALVRAPAHPEVLRRAIQLSLAAEPEGIARASRVGKLAHALVDRSPNDPWASLVLARSLAQTGDKLSAARRFAFVEQLAPETSVASEAQRARFALEEPQLSLEIDALLRAAYQAPSADLETIATRARRLAVSHGMWAAWFAVGIAERRLEHWRASRDAYLEALRVSPGCTPAHLEVVGAYVALEDSESSLLHARRACELDGATARTLAVLATAQLAAGHHEEAREAIDRSLALDATDETNRALAETHPLGRPPFEYVDAPARYARALAPPLIASHLTR